MLNYNKLETIPLVSVPVSKFSYSNFLSEVEKQYFRQYTNFGPRRDDEPYISDTYSLFDDEVLFNLKIKFDTAIRHYVEHTLCTPELQFKITGSWFTKNTRSTKHAYHCHPNVMLSAVTYFDDSLLENDEIPGIMFFNKKLSNVFPAFKFDFKDVKTTQWNIFNYENYTINPKLNDVLIFPGHLFHQSTVNNSDCRFCIGANYFLTGSIGSNSTFSSLTM